MAVNKNTGAATRDNQNWESINWTKAENETNRLQARIVKATKEGRLNKVKALQRLLTTSFSAKGLAVRRATNNRGSKTPGVDGKTWNTPTRKFQAIGDLKRYGYQPQPLRRLHSPKKNGKMRPLSIPTMHDRAMQALYLLAVDPVIETTSDRHSYGFRKARSAIDVMDQCHIVLGKQRSAKYILDADIKACFDEINHEWLIENVVMDKVVLKKMLKAGYMERRIYYDTIVGTPQGGIISPALANCALNGLEKLLTEHFPTRKGHKVNMVRYADDFIITARSKELLENNVIPLLKEFLRKRGLRLSTEKTSIVHIEDGFDFLGQNARRFKDKVTLIRPSAKNVKAFLKKIKKIIKANGHLTQEQLIAILNPIIRGWANYHKHACSKKTFANVDHCITLMLLWWCRRRHPGKPERWIVKKYFGKWKNRNWAFQAVTKEDDQTKQVRLVKASDVPITRHIKIRGEANPYDLEWQPYFRDRSQSHKSRVAHKRR